MKRSLASIFAIAVTITILTMGQPLRAQNPRTTQAPNRKVLTAPVLPAPCCTITSIDTNAGVVTAKVNANGNIFQFKVTNAALLNSLKIGQGVYANFTSNQVSLDGTTACCAIITPPAPPASPAGGVPPPVANKPATSLPAAPSAAPLAVGAIGSTLAPVTPCCEITAIDTSSGVVTAKVNANGNIFQFKVTDAALLNSLKIGQGVYANFKSNQVSLDGTTACCAIITPPAPPPPPPAGSSANSPASPSNATPSTGGMAQPSDAKNAAIVRAPVQPFPCCEVTVIDSHTSIGTAKENANGNTFEFQVTKPELLRQIQPGTRIYANFRARAVSLDDITAFGTILDPKSTHTNPGMGATAPSRPGPASALSSGVQPVTEQPVSSGKSTLAPVPTILPSPGSTQTPFCSSPPKTLQQANKEMMAVCLYATPPPTPNQTVRVQYTTGNKITTRAVVKGVVDEPVLYRFAVVDLTFGYEAANSGGFSTSSTWVVVDFSNPSTYGDWTLNMLGKPFVIKVTARVNSKPGPSGKPGPSDLEVVAGNYELVDDATAVQYFRDEIWPVMLHPRCSNCHANGDVPTQGDDQHLHVPPVTRQTDCKQCHGSTNGATLGSPPGAVGWRMAPFAFARRSAAQLCRQLSDPAHNGGRSLQGLLDHLLNSTTVPATPDPLANWSYNPGPGRTPAPGGSLFDGIWMSVKNWIEEGAGCPTQ